MTPLAFVQRLQRDRRSVPPRRTRPLAGARGLDLVASMTLLGPTAWTTSPRA